jgi:phosphonatase-like hydrolase
VTHRSHAPIQLAALDMAGTTIDEGGAVYEALGGAVAAGGRPATDEAIQRWMGADKREAISGLIEESSGSAPDRDTVERLYIEFRTLLEAAYEERPPQPIAGVPGALGALRAAGVKVALTTGFSREVAEPMLKGLGWTIGSEPTCTVNALVCADDVAAGRPAPYMIFRAMEATGVYDVRTVAVAGDTVVDLRAGMNAGARIVVGVATGKLTHADLAGEPHTHLIDSVGDLPPLVDALRPAAVRRRPGR